MSIEHLLTKSALEKLMERKMTRRDFGQTIVGVVGTANKGTIQTAENLAFSLGRIGRIEDKVGELGGWLRVFRARGAEAPSGQEGNEADQQILRDVMVAVCNSTAMMGGYVLNPDNPRDRRPTGRWQPLSYFQEVVRKMGERLDSFDDMRVGVSSLGIDGRAQIALGVDNSDITHTSDTIVDALDRSGGYNNFNEVLTTALQAIQAGRAEIGDKVFLLLPLTSHPSEVGVEQFSAVVANLVATANQLNVQRVNLTVIYGHEPNYYNPEADLRAWVIPMVEAAGGRLVNVQDILEDPTLIDQHLRPNAPGWISSGEGSVSVVPTPTPVTNP